MTPPPRTGSGKPPSVGSPTANLAILHENGREEDPQEAYKWFWRCGPQRRSRSGAPAGAGAGGARMEPVEVDDAEQRLAAWRPMGTDAVTGSLGARARR